MKKRYIANKVRCVLNKADANSLYDIARFLNITILEDYLGDIGGFYFYIVKNKLILLNNSLSDSHKKIVLAHEISHAIIHTRLNCAFYQKHTLISTTKIENEANYCAALLLKELSILTDDVFCVHSEEITEKDSGFLAVINQLAKMNKH